MITEETMKRLDAMLRRYSEMGWKKCRRLLKLIAEYVPQGKIEHVLDKSEPKNDPSKTVQCNMYGSDKTFDEWVREASVKETKW